MIKTVRFNLEVDGKPCRSIEEVSENFNLVDVMEHLDSGKLQLWLDRRNLGKLPDLSGSSLFDKAKVLYQFFGVEASDIEINDELCIYDYVLQSRNMQKSYSYDEIKSIFEKFRSDYQNNILEEVITEFFGHLKPNYQNYKKISFSNSGYEKYKWHEIEILEKGIYFSPINIYSNYLNQTKDYLFYDNFGHEIEFVDLNIGMDWYKLNNQTTFNGLKLKFKSLYSDDNIQIEILDLFNVIDIKKKRANGVSISNISSLSSAPYSIYRDIAPKSALANKIFEFIKKGDK